MIGEMPSPAARVAGAAAAAGLATSALLFALPQADSGTRPTAPVSAAPASAPLAFEPGAGRGSADYYARLGSGAVAISPKGMRFTVRGGALATTLVGAQSVAGEAERRLRMRVNAYDGADRSDWRTGLPAFGRIRYPSVYPGVDLLYHGRGQRLEYDFVIAPGADPSRIALDVRGGRSLRLDAAGNLVAAVGGTKVRQLRPVAYQGSDRVAARFVLDGSRVRFALGDYDRTRPLVIDPVLAFSDAIAAETGFTQSFDVGVDSQGNAYVVGDTSGTATIPAGSSSGSGSGFILKIAPDGTRQWVTYLAGAHVSDIDFDGSDNVYVAGYTQGGLPVLNAHQQNYGGGTTDALVGRLSPGSGTLSWLTYYGGTSFDANDNRFVGIAADRSGGVYVGGATGSSSGIATGGAFDTQLAGSSDGFVVKFTSTGSRVAGTYFGGNTNDEVTAVDVNPTCQSSCPVFLAGGTDSDQTSFPVLNALDGTHNGNFDGFAAKLQATFVNRDWATYYGGADHDRAWAVAVDPNGYPSIAGYRDQTFAPGNTSDVFVQTYFDNGTHLFHREVSGSADDQAYDLVAGSALNLYLVGTTASSDFPTVSPAQSDPGGAGDAFVMRINSNFAASNPVLWSTRLGGGNSEQGYGIALGQFGDVWVAGQTISNDFPRVGATQPPPALGGFVSKISINPVEIQSGPEGTLRSRDAAFTYSAGEPGATYSCRLNPVETSFSSCPTTGKSYTGLADGDYTFEVRVTDNGFATGRPTARAFSVDTKPVAQLAIAPNPALVGSLVTFDAGGSSGAGRPLTKFEWDLDGDGAFERDTGGTATTTETFASPRDNPVSVRVTDSEGLTATAGAQLRVNPPPALGSQFGVTINNGAQFTRTPNVTVAARFPASTTSMLFSNDGGFLSPTVFPPSASVKWKLDSSGPERLPKQIYVRFLAGTIPSETFQDDIILDEVPPRVQQAIVAPAASASVAHISAVKRRWRVRVRATDSNSGVARLQITSNKRRPGKLLRYRRRLTVRSVARPKWVRARDRAGNFSRWRRAR